MNTTGYTRGEQGLGAGAVARVAAVAAGEIPEEADSDFDMLVQTAARDQWPWGQYALPIALQAGAPTTWASTSVHVLLPFDDVRRVGGELVDARAI